MSNSTNNFLSYQNECSNNTNTYNTSVCTNSGFNYGYSSNIRYDPEYIQDDINQSTAPILSILDPNRVKNCNQCLSLNGPRAGHNGWGNSIPIQNPSITPAQDLVDIDSIMSNRNVKYDKSKKGFVNPIDVFQFNTFNSNVCNKDLDPLSSTLTYPKQLYREMSINRFYDLNINPQVNIYYDWGVNTKLEAKDNYDSPYPFSINDLNNPGDLSLPPTSTETRTSRIPSETRTAPEVYTGRIWSNFK